MKLSDLTIKRRGKESRSLCPECSHQRKKTNDPCLAVNMTTGLYHCHNCGTSGILEDFKMKEEEYTPIELPKAELTGEHFEYFNSRGITLEVAQRNGITSGKNDWIAFNYYEGDQIMNIKYRHTKEKKFMQSKGGKPIFYGVNDIQEELIITEGEFDKLSFEVAGFTSCVSVPMGAPNESDKNVDGKLKCLYLAEDKINACKTVYLACDNDDNGRRLTTELARRIGIEKCLKVDLKDCKDANEMLVKYGRDSLVEAINNAKPFPIDGVSTINDHWEEVLDLYENGYDEGYRIGYQDFDEYFRWNTGYLMTFTGIPSHGKSNFVEQIAVKLAARHGIKFGVFSPEHFPPAHFFQRFMRIYIGKSMFGHNRMTPADMEQARQFIQEHFYIIHNNDEDHTLDGILSTAKQLVFRYGIKGVIIDPWTDIEHQMGAGDNETRYTAQQLAKIKQFNRMHLTSTMVIAHPRKMGKREDGSYIVPTLYDISGSANFYNKSDFGITVYRDMDDNAEIHIQKVKQEGIMGKKGTCTFAFDTSSSRYYEHGQNRGGIEQPTQTLTKIEYDDDVPF